jgi:NAD(P)-dependent dehydrogenase (short-subunit alcohol dehydrogenase family)
MQRLSGKKALITGSGTGIGRAVALEFARQGADVALHYASSRDGAEQAAAECRAAGSRAVVHQADLSQPENCVALVDWAVRSMGGLDILVNNAGITEKHAFLEVTPPQFDRLFQVNVRGQFFCAQQAVRHMLPQGHGALINVTSIHAFAGMPEHAIYAGTKGAICAWTRELAIELAPVIRVNAVAPGWIDVPRQYQTPGYDPALARAQVPGGRAGTPVDVAKACVYLASNDAAYMTGHVLVLDGGTTAWMSLAAARTRNPAGESASAGSGPA